MYEATLPLFGNRAVHRMDGDYVGEPGRVSKRARPGGHQWKEMTAIVCRIIMVCLPFFSPPHSDGRGGQGRDSARSLLSRRLVTPLVWGGWMECGTVCP